MKFSQDEWRHTFRGTLSGEATLPFSLAGLYKSTETYFCHFDVGMGLRVTFKNFHDKVFNVMGKALSGELCCIGTGHVLACYKSTGKVLNSS